jgi:hypothetical protein
LHILDVSNPATPVRVSGVQGSNLWVDVFVAGEYAYLAGSFGLHIIDVSDPANPSIAAHHTLHPGTTMSVVVAGNHAYVPTGDGGLRIVDVSDPQAPANAGAYEAPAWAYEVAVLGEHAYVADGFSGVRILDMTGSMPEQIGRFDTPGFVESIVVSGTHAYVADDHGGLRILDVSNPTVPAEVGARAEWQAMDVAVAGHYAYIVTGISSAGVRIVDVSDPTNPEEVGCYCPQESWTYHTVFANNDYVYLSAQYGRAQWVHILDVSDPNARELVGAVDSGYEITDIAGEYAFMIDTDSNLQVMDVSTPAEPETIGYFDGAGRITDVGVSGDYAYVAEERAWNDTEHLSGGLRVLDVSDPSTPRQVGFYYLPVDSPQVTVVGNDAYLVANWQGLFRLRFNPAARDLYLPLLMK